MASATSAVTSTRGRHPDVRVLGVQEIAGQRAISIDAVREVQRQAYLRPFEGQWRVTIIDGAEYLSEPAANALLKTLEEPPPNVLLVLLATNAEGVLPTIRSRCQRLDHRPLAEEDVAEALSSRWEVPSEQAGELARLSRGCIGWALRAWRDPTVLETRARRLERLIKVSGGALEERFAHAGELAALLAQERSAVREVPGPVERVVAGPARRQGRRRQRGRPGRLRDHGAGPGLYGA